MNPIVTELISTEGLKVNQQVFFEYRDEEAIDERYNIHAYSDPHTMNDRITIREHTVDSNFTSAKQLIQLFPDILNNTVLVGTIISEKEKYGKYYYSNKIHIHSVDEQRSERLRLTNQIIAICHNKIAIHHTLTMDILLDRIDSIIKDSKNNIEIITYSDIIQIQYNLLDKLYRTLDDHIIDIETVIYYIDDMAENNLADTNERTIINTLNAKESIDITVNKYTTYSEYCHLQKILTSLINDYSIKFDNLSQIYEKGEYLC